PRNARGSSRANARTQVSPTVRAVATSPSTVTTSPTWPPASCHEMTGGAAARAAAAASATRETSARARFTGAVRAPDGRRGSLAFASAHAAAAAAPAAAAPAAGRPLARLTHGERPAPELRAVEGADRRLGLGIGGELDEGEAARPPGLPVRDDLHLFDLAPILLEQGAQLRLVALVGQVTYVQSLSHSSSRTNEDAEHGPPPFPWCSAAL